MPVKREESPCKNCRLYRLKGEGGLYSLLLHIGDEFRASNKTLTQIRSGQISGKRVIGANSAANLENAGHR